jgi:hypothetical protein
MALAFDTAADLHNALSFEELLENPNAKVDELEPLPLPPPVLFAPEVNASEPMDVDVAPPSVLYLDEEAPEADVPDDSDGEQDMAICNDAEPVALDHPSRPKLLNHGIYVDPTYNWIVCIDCGDRFILTDIHGHRRTRHPPHEMLHKLPDRVELETMLVEVNGHCPKDPPRHAIPQIQGLNVVDVLRCGIEGCGKIVYDKKALSKHYLGLHPDIPTKQRSYSPAKAHPMSSFRNRRQYVEVLEAKDPANDERLQSVLDRFAELGVGKASSVFQANENHRSRTPFVVATNWDVPLNGVNLKLLRRTVRPPDCRTERRLQQISRTYYMHIGDILRSQDIATMTLRYIHSADPQGDLKAAPFKRPQLDNTISYDSNLLVNFVCFLVRHKLAPVPNYSIELHDVPSSRLSELDQLLKDERPDVLVMTALHNLVFALLTHPGPAFLRQQWKEPLLQFLIAHHLNDDFGTFVRPSGVPPNFSKIQWCLRATAVKEIQLKKDQFDGNCFKYVFS